MATELCQKCKQSHPGRICDYDDKGDCAETADNKGIIASSPKSSKDPDASSKSALSKGV
jgi:hypothetical protein